MTGQTKLTLDLTLRVTCVEQLSQFLRCFYKAFTIFVTRTTTWMVLMQVQVGTKVNCLHQTCLTWTVKRSAYQPGKVGSAHPPLPDQRHHSTKSYLSQIKQKSNIPWKHLLPGNLRGWFLKPSKTGKFASVVLYLHGITATRAYAPRVLPFCFHNTMLSRVQMKCHFSKS